MKPKLVACDIDGTLLREGQPELSQEILALVRLILDTGIAFTAASGRQYAGLRTLFAEFGSEISYVAENGTIAHVGNEFVQRIGLDRALGEEIAETILSRPECELYVAGVETCYIMPRDAAYVKHLTDDLLFHVTEIERISEIPEPFLKVSAYHAAHDPNGEFWENRFGACCNVVVSGADWVDLTPSGVSKASGVKAVCERLGIDPADCIAFGDADNDVEMFDLVGRPIAMEWASVAAKAHASETVASVLDVLSRVVA